MKKVIIMLVLSMTLIVSFIGCADKNNPQNQNGNNPTITTGQDQSKVNPVKTDSGTYNGRIDSNFIEVKISGVPEENAIRSFMLNEKVKNEFDSYNLKSGDVIKFNYQLNSYNQGVIEKIEKI